jgi:hypothetical protein
MLTVHDGWPLGVHLVRDAPRTGGVQTVTASEHTCVHAMDGFRTVAVELMLMRSRT